MKDSVMILAMGANIGSPRENLDRAVSVLDSFPGIRIEQCSSLYRSEPWGDPDQPAFLNVAVAGRTTLTPHGLLDAVGRAEQRLGRRPTRRWGPRVIDIDIISLDCQRVDEEDLHLPHARAGDRPFVYLPVADLDAPPEVKSQSAPTEEGRAIEQDTSRLPADGIWPSRSSTLGLELTTRSEEETARVGESLGRAALPGTIIALNGPLGAGKTAFVRGLARGLGIEGPIQSPSYTLCREHREGRLPLFHWDFYRLESEGDLETTGYGQTGEERGVTAVEWAGRFPDEFSPECSVHIRIERGKDAGVRKLEIHFPPGSYPLRAALQQFLREKAQ